MSHEPAPSLNDVDELEPDPLGNPAARAFQGSVTHTPSGKPYDVVEGQFPETRRPDDYENERILLARHSGQLALVFRLIGREGEEGEEADAELQIDHGLQHPDDLAAITEFVMTKHALKRVVARLERVWVSPQIALDAVEPLIDRGFESNGTATLELARAS